MESLSYLAGANLFELDSDLKPLLARYDPSFKEPWKIRLQLREKYTE